MSAPQYDLNTLNEIAQRLSPLQQRLLQSLKNKGPGLLLELAVRVLEFPDEVQSPLRELQTWGLVETQSVAGGQFGAELFRLASLGDRILQLMNDPAFQRAAAAPEAAAPAAPDPRREEAELLRQMGDVAKESGDLAKALEYYEKALEITRELSATTGGAK